MSSFDSSFLDVWLRLELSLVAYKASFLTELYVQPLVF